MIKRRMCTPSMLPMTLARTFHYLEWYVLAGLWPGLVLSKGRVRPRDGHGACLQSTHLGDLSGS